MTTTARTTVVGVFHDIEDARDAVEALKDEGFAADNVGLLAHDQERGREVAEETGTRSHVGEGAATGLVAGGIDLPSVKSAMGHSRLSTTERYLHARPAGELADRFTRALSGGSVVPELSRAA